MPESLISINIAVRITDLSVCLSIQKPIYFPRKRSLFILIITKPKNTLCGQNSKFINVVTHVTQAKTVL